MHSLIQVQYYLRVILILINLHSKNDTQSTNKVFVFEDLHTVDLEDFQYGGTNITGYKLVDEDSQAYADALESWRSPALRSSGKEPSLTTEAALLYDATRLFSRALTDLDRGQKIHIKSLSCETEEPWPHGISFNQLYENVREWNIHTGLNMTTNFYTRAAEEIIQSLKNKTLVATVLIKITNHWKATTSKKGYCIDLLKEISKILGFHFKIKEVDDKKYGEKNDQGEWNGMIKELIDGVKAGLIRFENSILLFLRNFFTAVNQ
ncbi:glutamate receptor ionotropic, kainate 1 [Caerostris extrusa]|uniref:Glutamate receptor ionotropic, kainate 1 n=1 Tax=Caerostris extrusa TaxID=172846 RepID=A0AAV4SGS4_CAEEX|nr:glutamate receptor ionotropic, kainate 1 [Caerostris extrusa]